MRARRFAIACVFPLVSLVLFCECASDYAVNTNDAGGADASTADASDASTHDSTTDVVVQSDATTTPDARSPAFCDDASWLCDDFDTPPASWPSPQWDTRVLVEGGTVAISDAQALSPPNALNIALPPHATSLTASLASTFIGPMRGIHCAFDLFVDRRGQNTLDIFQVHAPSASGSYDVDYVGLAIDTGTLTFLHVNTGTSMVAGIPAAKWTHVVIDSVFTSGTTVTFNGTPQLTPDGGVADGAAPAQAVVTFYGGQSGSDSMGWSVFFDDVRCDPIP
jgi:hypothetical protein